MIAHAECDEWQSAAHHQSSSLEVSPACYSYGKTFGHLTSRLHLRLCLLEIITKGGRRRSCPRAIRAEELIFFATEWFTQALQLDQKPKKSSPNFSSFEGTSSEEGVGICFSICENLLGKKVRIPWHDMRRKICEKYPKSVSSFLGIYVLCNSLPWVNNYGQFISECRKVSQRFKP